ncbi:MAG: preprotein translocase subunit SecY [Verrucomicrobiota bacterium]|nr:preprotein translocase subunit SecY [Verrucomicrobiota bacterium]
MISAFLNCLKIPELRDRIFFTLFMLFIARLGAHIPLPGLDPIPLQEFFRAQSDSANSVLGLYNMFTGGALLKGSVFALGIMPYISASIIMQLMGAVVPTLSRLAQEGDVGRQKITQYTRYATLIICIVQGLLLLLTLENPSRLFPGFDAQVYGNIVIMGKFQFLSTAIVFLTAGTMLLMWLGEQITQRGIGNGTSLLIAVGILSDIPGAFTSAYNLFFGPVGSEATLNIVWIVILIAMLVAVIAGIVAITQAQRKIPVQYAKRVVGKKVYGGQSSFLPLKINYSGVMPIIFGSAILLFLQTIFGWMGSAFNVPYIVQLSNHFQHGQMWYYIIYSTLIFAFSYFWVSVMFKPVQVADDLKKYGGYIPGVRPGDATAKFLDFVMTRLTLAGAVTLTIIAVMPDLLYFTVNIPFNVAQFFGGTGMLIIVGVMLDTLRQVETFLLQRHYDGFLKKGRIRGRSVGAARQTIDTSALKNAKQFTIALIFGITIGLICAGLNMYYFK